MGFTFGSTHPTRYNEGDVHSPRRESDTRLIRIEGVDLTKVPGRPKYEIAETAPAK
jgi:hypothetical protein